MNNTFALSLSALRSELVCMGQRIRVHRDVLGEDTVRRYDDMQSRVESLIGYAKAESERRTSQSEAMRVYMAWSENLRGVRGFLIRLLMGRAGRDADLAVFCAGVSERVHWELDRAAAKVMDEKFSGEETEAGQQPDRAA